MNPGVSYLFSSLDSFSYCTHPVEKIMHKRRAEVQATSASIAVPLVALEAAAGATAGAVTDSICYSLVRRTWLNLRDRREAF